MATTAGRGPTSRSSSFRALGALDKPGLLVVPLLLGEGMRLTRSLSAATELVLESERSLPGGWVEIVYACNGEWGERRMHYLLLLLRFRSGP